MGSVLSPALATELQQALSALGSSFSFLLLQQDEAAGLTFAEFVFPASLSVNGSSSLPTKSPATIALATAAMGLAMAMKGPSNT